MIDILLNEENDISIVNGDFKIGESEQQEIESILIAFKGEFKNTPLLGAEIPRMLKARNTRQGITREIGEQLKYDGFRNIDFNIEDAENFTINAQRDAT
ncbi:hypothetical protein HNP38_002770 [Chryseobacterium defluvii]|uniref:Uncharacterized protein n=1 Tax=Chryseobacterium defluvii TaxID=160396 RepID=A0A840KIF3_9FLAO|nr:oxidase [Chryseobacterium defluvii]MBB4807464.1 hypothetical protein [Chryseobacterium defluvii]